MLMIVVVDDGGDLVLAMANDLAMMMMNER